MEKHLSEMSLAELIREDDAGGLSVSGDAAVGSTVVAKGETVAFTISRGASSRRRCTGFTDTDDGRLVEDTTFCKPSVSHVKHGIADGCLAVR